MLAPIIAALASNIICFITILIASLLTLPRIAKLRRAPAIVVDLNQRRLPGVRRP